MPFMPSSRHAPAVPLVGPPIMKKIVSTPSRLNAWAMICSPRNAPMAAYLLHSRSNWRCANPQLDRLISIARLGREWCQLKLVGPARAILCVQVVERLGDFYRIDHDIGSLLRDRERRRSKSFHAPLDPRRRY